MGTFNEDDDDTDNSVVHPPVGLQIVADNVIAKPHYIADVIDTRYTPLESILTYMGGTPVYFDYYQQVVTKQTELRPPQITSSTENTVQQQYRYIKNLEVRQDDSITPTYNEDKTSFSIAGSIKFYPRVVPNKEDILIGDIGQGKGGIFRISRSEPLQYTVQRIHQVDIEFVREISDTEYLSYLNRHTIETYHFNTDYLRLGKDPLMTTQAFDVMKRLAIARRDLLNRFLGKFWNPYYRAPVLNHSGRTVYDPLLTKAIANMCDRYEHPRLNEMFMRSVDEGPQLEIPTIWNMIVDCNEDMFYAIHGKMWVLARCNFGRYATQHGLRYSNIDYIIYPRGAGNFDGALLYEMEKTPLQLAISHFIFDDLDNPSNPGVPTPQPNLPGPGETISPLYTADFPVLTSDDYYVFSSAFYNDIPKYQSKIEREVKKMLRHEKIDLEAIVTMCQDLKQRPDIEQFFYTVVLLGLTRYGINHSY